VDPSREYTFYLFICLLFVEDVRGEDRMHVSDCQSGMLARNYHSRIIGETRDIMGATVHADTRARARACACMQRKTKIIDTRRIM